MTPTRPLGGALQLAVGVLARDALAVGVKGTLPTNQHYLDTEGIGAGTLQRALDELRARRAVRTQSRGHLGRVVTGINVGAAWKTGQLGPLRLALPPAGPPELETLEQVVSEALSKLAIPHTPTRQRDTSPPLARLPREADLALCSAGDLAAGPRPSGLLVRRLGPGTYYGPGRVVVVRRQGEAGPPRRIALDPDSPDHAALTRAEFPEAAGHEYVTVAGAKVPAAVVLGEADAGLWHMTPSVVPLDRAGLALSPLATAEGLAAWEAVSAAILGASPKRPELKAVLPALDLRELAARQAAVA
jgi:hypothetical protein